MPTHVVAFLGGADFARGLDSITKELSWRWLMSITKPCPIEKVKLSLIMPVSTSH